MASSLLFCDRCGASNRPQARFCTSCGNRLPLAAVAVSTLTGRLDSNTLLGQRYRIIKLLGRGGMGAVYLVEDLRLGRALRAVKELSQSGLSGQQLREATEAFEREAMILSQLNSPHLPHIYDHFAENGRWYLVMDYIEGETLEERISKRPGGKCEPVEALSIALQLCAVLNELHTHEPPIIFRDLKPANIMLTASDHVYLIDFGIARFFKMGQVKDTMALGSPGYAAPEQYGRAQTTPGSDIYSLGATLHRMLSGYDPSADPFQFEELQLDHLPRGSELAELVQQMVELKREKRPAGVALIGQRLQEIADQSGVKAGNQAAAQQAARPPVPLITAQHPVVLPPPPPVAVQPAPVIPPPVILRGLIVDQTGGGQYRTIGEALKAAKENETIVVRPGYYQEELVLDKAVEIIGDGPREYIRLDGLNGSTLTMQTEQATVQNLTLYRSSKGQNLFAVVDVPQGQLVLEDCDIRSDLANCLYIHTLKANPTLRRCRIHESPGDGIVVSDEGQGLIEECEIFGHKGNGLVITSNANPVIKHCRFYNGAGNGIYVYGSGKGLFEDCAISNHIWAQVTIEGEGNPTLRQCELYDGKGPGAYVSKQGQGIFEYCNIYNNGQSGVVILEQGNPFFSQCKIYDGKQAGVYVHRKGLGIFEDCHIYNNVLAGVEIKKEGNPTLRQCIIRDGKQSGVDIYDKGLGIVEDCEIVGNAYSGITVSDRGFPTIRRCKVHHGKRSGILVCDSGQGVIEECEVFANMQAGITISRNGDPVVRQCRIYNQLQEAIYVHDRGRGTISDCDLRGNKKGAWDISPDSIVLHNRNRV